MFAIELGVTLTLTFEIVQGQISVCRFRAYGDGDYHICHHSRDIRKSAMQIFYIKMNIRAEKKKGIYTI